MRNPHQKTRDLRPVAETTLYPHQSVDLPRWLMHTRTSLLKLPGSPPWTQRYYGEAITHYPTTQPSQRNLGRYSPKTNFRSLNNKGETCANHPSVKLCSTFRTNNNKEPPYPSHRSTQWTYPTSTTLNTMRNPRSLGTKTSYRTTASRTVHASTTCLLDVLRPINSSSINKLRPP